MICGFAAINAMKRGTPHELPRVRCRCKVTPDSAFPGLIGRRGGDLGLT